MKNSFNTFRYIKHRYYSDINAVTLYFKVHGNTMDVAVACLSPKDITSYDKDFGKRLAITRTHAAFHRMVVHNADYNSAAYADTPLVNAFLIHLLKYPFKYPTIIHSINNSQSVVRLPINSDS